MASSELEHYVRFSPTKVYGVSGDGPVDTGTSVRALGNLAHLADQFAQVRSRWVARNSSDVAKIDPNVTFVINKKFLLWTTAAFDLHLRPDGSAYDCRWRVRGARSGAAGTTTFSVGLVPLRFAEAQIQTNDVDVSTSTTTSLTHAWLTPADALLRLPPDLVAAVRADVSTVDTVAGTERSASWLEVYAQVWGEGNNVAAAPECSGLEISEYFAP